MSFSSLSLNATLVNTITELGYSLPTPIQSEAIPVILAKQDVMAGAQTGTGKTAAFALPILHLLMAKNVEQKAERVKTVQALVLVPTRELAVQVHQSFVKYAKNTDIRIGIAYGGVSIDAQVDVFKTGIDVLIATPGRLLDHLRQGVLNLNQLSTLVFDEADRMLDMGFMDEINAVLKKVPKDRQTLLFSATLDDAIFELSKSLLREPKLIEVTKRNTTAAQVEQRVYAIDSDRKTEFVSHLIRSNHWHQVLIFSRTKQGVDRLVQQLNKLSIVTHAFHGDLSQGAREKVLQAFKLGNIQVLVATDVAARGLDIVELKYVINFELPFIAEDYIHRIGRTGRAGSAGLAITLFSQEDTLLLEEVEVVLDKRLPQQWYPGFEPDFNKMEPE
ncbi:DEAD/DEAH box helicase, partial [Shewanella putrefaciens]